MPNKNTLFVGKVLLRFSTLDSTNRYASELLAKSKPIEGTVISTYQQTDGRGQIGNKWESEPGSNITMSLILYPTFLEVRRQFLLNQAVALAVRDFAANFSEIDVRVKWPNDIYARDQKLAGILIQNTLAGTTFSASVIGIGINVNQVRFPAGLPNPASLKSLTGRTFDPEALIPDLCALLETRYLQIRQGKESLLRQTYHEHLYRIGETALFRQPGGTPFAGRITGVDDQGKLMIESGGKTSSYGFKEVLYITE